MAKLSVIVPFYNEESHLDRCLHSILVQTENDLEVILVDDGSTDESVKVCEKYTKKDARFSLICTKNEGVGAARNHGMRQAKGKYIGFVDADDWIDENMFARMLAIADETEADVVMCDARTVYENGTIKADTIKQLSQSCELEKSDLSPSIMLEMAGAVWRCIYRNELCNQKNGEKLVSFPVGIKFSEDRIFNIYAFGYAQKLVYIKEAYYNRFVNTKSAVHRFHEDYFDAQKKAAQGIRKAIEEAWNDDKNYQVAYLRQFIDGAMRAIGNIYCKMSLIKRNMRRDAVKQICEDCDLRNALQATGEYHITAKWLNRKKIRPLIVYAKLRNLKNRQ